MDPQTASAPHTWKGLTLTPFQRRAAGAARSGRNVLLSAPTGAGKTLVAELAIEDACQRGRRAIYTAPIKALSNQKFRDFRAAGLDAGLMTGDVTVNPRGRVLVMTTEILRNSIFESPDLLRDVQVVVFDEIHYLDDSERGTVWEETLIFAPPSMRFVCLSATISNLDELGAWMRAIRPQELEVVSSTHRPVPLSWRLWVPRVGRFPPERLEAVRRRLRHSRRGSTRRGRSRHDRRPDPRPALSELAQAGELPALCFCFSRKECERLAREVRRANLLDSGESERLEALLGELHEAYSLSPERRGAPLYSLARRGIAFHHAGMLPADKEVVERLFTSGLVKLLFATETFALGINMPARAVVFPSLRKFDGVSVDWLRTRDFLQMAGRAGRQGLDSEGLVLSILGPTELDEAPLERLFEGQPEPVRSRFRLSYSSILHLVLRAGRERAFEAWEKSFDRFQHERQRPGARQRNRARQHRSLEARLHCLTRLGYLDDDDRLTARGRVARSLNGFEVAITELLFEGVLEDLAAPALCVVFVGLVHEERRPGPPPRVPQRLYGDLRRRVDRTLERVWMMEVEEGLRHPIRRPSWGLSRAVLDWIGGGDLGEIAERTGVGAGDLCRTLRLALQLMRQTRQALDPAWDVRERLGEAMSRVRRGEVDARRQLEIGLE